MDAAVPELIAACGKEDLMIITADHGCDPVTPGTDHTREYIPLLARLGSEVFSPGGSLFETAPPVEGEAGGVPARQPRDQPYIGEFGDIGATMFRFFTGPKLELAEALRLAGRPFLVTSGK